MVFIGDEGAEDHHDIGVQGDEDEALLRTWWGGQVPVSAGALGRRLRGLRDQSRAVGEVPGTIAELGRKV